MKIIGQSSFTTTPPYMHLGYVATTMLHYSKPLTDVCLGLIAVGLLIGFRLRSNGQGRRIKTHVLFRRPIAWGIAGMSMVLVGVLVLLLAPARYTSVYSKPGMMTFAQMVTLHEDISMQREKGGAIPDSIHEVAKGDPELIQDVWGTELRYEKTTRDGKEDCLFISAGPDRQFGTTDDLTYPRNEG